MRISEGEFNRLPPHLQALFKKAPNPGSAEVEALFPQSNDGVAGKRTAAGQNTIGLGLAAYDDAWGGYGGSGSAARFFYAAKASRAERGEGNTHPCVKPLSLMQYLVRLVTPPGGVVLDPFAGSGSTGVACLREGFRPILMELDPGHAEIIRSRVAREMERQQAQPSDGPQLSLGFA